MLAGKKIILGVTASIAAYKAAFLARLLVKAGADVRVVMTPDSIEFVSQLTFSTLTGNPAPVHFTKGKEGEWTNHIELGNWADLIILAPLTANTLAKMATGMCDNLLLAVYLSAPCPVIIAPAMDLEMYAHESVKHNLDILRKRGNAIIPATKGLLASGMEGEGRMEEPEKILKFIEKYFKSNLPLSGKRALVTAGPTYEPIDPVRFVGNRSSGKMGFAIALQLAKAGAEVELVTGPTSLSITHPFIRRTDIETGQEMFKACKKLAGKMDLMIMTAAVADFTPENPSEKKIKKEGKKEMVITMTENPDILKTLSLNRKKNQIIVGFALETNNEIANAKKKLDTKKLDMIVLNSLNDQGAGFGSDTNKITLIESSGKIHKFDLKPKSEIAQDIVETIIHTYFEK